MKTVDDCQSCKKDICGDCGAVYGRQEQEGAKHEMPFYTKCHICGSHLDPGESCDCQKPVLSPEELIAREMLESLRKMQENGEHFPCPRCGHDRMDENPVRNALSRYAKVYICDKCGTHEALLDMPGHRPFPLTEWAMIIGLRGGGDESEM